MTPAELELKIDRAIQDRSTHLDLYQQHLTTLPDSLGNLTDLVSLRVVDNNLTNLPYSIGNLTNLRELRLYHNQLKTLPDSITNLQQLTWLSLSLNRFTVFPEQITELTNLIGLRLNGNQLTVLPQSITRLTNLTHLDISGNSLVDLSVLNDLPNIKIVKFWGINLPRKYWIYLRSIPSALQLISGKIVELEIKFENFKHLSNESLIRLPNNLGKYLPTTAEQDEAIDPRPESLSFIDRIAKKILVSANRNLDRTLSDSHLHLSKNKLTSLPLDIGKLTHLTCIELRGNQLTSLPASIGNLRKLTHLDLRSNQLSSLPASIDNLTNLTHLYLGGNLFETLPDAIGEMKKLTHLHLNGNSLTSLPDSLKNLNKLVELYINSNNLDWLNLSIDGLTSLKHLNMSRNQIAKLPSLGNLVNLVSLNLSDNKLTELPESIISLRNLTSLNLLENPLVDLSMLQSLPKLSQVYFLGMYHFPRRYWTRFSDWKAEWLLEETNAELRRTLIQELGYEKICQELNAIQLDSWREYTLVKIDGIERFRDWQRGRDIHESMVLLKMTCPSTGHIHVLRVPPEMTSAEAAITWVNHGIHPDKFIIQT